MKETEPRVFQDNLKVDETQRNTETNQGGVRRPFSVKELPGKSVKRFGSKKCQRIQADIF